MWSPTELTNVPKFASRYLMGTFSIISEVAWVGFPPRQVRSVSLLSFLLGGGTTFAGTTSLKMMSLEVMKFVEFIKWYIINRAHVFLNGTVKVEDFWMSVQVHWCKVQCNVVIVLLELSFSMRKNEVGGLENNSPCHDPVTMGFNSFSWLCNTEMQFKVSDVFNSSVICDGGSKDHVFGCLKVKHMVLHQFPSKFLIQRENYIIVIGKPGKKWFIWDTLLRWSTGTQRLGMVSLRHWSVFMVSIFFKLVISPWPFPYIAARLHVLSCWSSIARYVLIAASTWLCCMSSYAADSSKAVSINLIAKTFENKSLP